MDISETYIKMWLASGLEIEPDEYQLWICPNCFRVYIMPLPDWHWCLDGTPDLSYRRLKPLPRQDQLWDIMPYREGEVWMLKRIEIDCWDMTRFKPYLFFTGDTPEQALIQGVMYELHIPASPLNINII